MVRGVDGLMFNWLFIMKLLKKDLMVKLNVWDYLENIIKKKKKNK